MFNKKEEIKEIKEEKKEIKFDEKEKEENKIKQDEKNKLKEQKMSKALQILKKGREKMNEKKSENANNNNNFDDVKLKSMKIKNMAALLESHMNNNVNKDTEENNEIKKEGENNEEDPFDHMTKLIQNKDSKILNKKKMKKKEFEE